MKSGLRSKASELKKFMKKIQEKLKKVLESKILVGVLYGVGGILVLMLVFSLGVSVGFHKASFGKNWGENYERNFGMKHGDMLGKFEGRGENFPNAHGAVGKILKIELPNIIVIDKDNTEKVIVLNEQTKIQAMRQELKATDLKIDNFIVVIGSPDEKGQIEAKFIRLMPSGMPLPPQPGTFKTN